MEKQDREAHALLELVKLSKRDIEQGRVYTLAEVKERLKLRRNKLRPRN